MNKSANPADRESQKRTAEKLRFSVFFLVVACALCGGRAADVPAAHAISDARQRYRNAGGSHCRRSFTPPWQTGEEDLVLPGTLQAYVESPIYARTNGYLKKWYHDIGSRVSKGDLLADIDTPEVDQQLVQAKADLVTAQANLHLSQITATRYSGFVANRRSLKAGGG